MLRTLSVAALVVVLGACGSTSVTTPSETPTQATPTVSEAGSCAQVAANPVVTGAEPDEQRAIAPVVREVKTTRSAVDDWLVRRANAEAPQRDLTTYAGLGAADPSTSLTVCVFSVAPRPIPAPSGVMTKADGVRVFVTGSGTFAVDAIGSTDRLAAQLGDLR